MNWGWFFIIFILPFMAGAIVTEVGARKCANCRRVVLTGNPRVLDSYHGLQYICSEACWDGYRGWWCDTCALLHDFDTTMESSDSCI